MALVLSPKPREWVRRGQRVRVMWEYDPKRAGRVRLVLDVPDDVAVLRDRAVVRRKVGE